MSDMIRRNKAVPVQARRVEPEPQTIQIPAAGSIPVPPAQPGVTQNIIYVNVPAGHAPAPQAPAQPGEIHVHTHVHQYPSRRRGGRRGTSFLGTLGFVLGLVACGACQGPQLVWLARFIALAGLGCAGLAMIGSLLLGRVGRGMPLVGLMVSGFAYGLWMTRSGEGKLQLPKILTDNMPAISGQPAGDPSASAPKLPPMAPPPIPRSPESLGSKDHSIFGDGGHWGNGSVPKQPAPPQSAIPPVATPSSVPQPAMDIATAAANLESARIAAAQKAGIDYAAARTAAAAAMAEYEQTRQTASPGSAELIAASKARMDADSKVIQMQQMLHADPAVAAAEQGLKNARASGR